MNSITLSHVQFTEVSLKINSFEADVTKELKSDDFSVACMHNESPSTAFGIRFTLSLSDNKKEFSLRLDAVAHFLTDIPYDQSFLTSDFVKINAPAIAFPYIRTFISNLTLNSGYNPVFLPSYNFVELEKQRKELSNQKELKPHKKPKKTIKQ
jgi:preprotein translocase subunit SecB